MENTEKTEAILRKLPHHTLGPQSASAPFPAPIYSNVSLCALASTSHCCSVAKLCPTLCNPKDCSTPGFPVLYHLLEFAQTHVHWVTDAIWPPHPAAPFSFWPQSFRETASFQWICRAQFLVLFSVFAPQGCHRSCSFKYHLLCILFSILVCTPPSLYFNIPEIRNILQSASWHNLICSIFFFLGGT